MKYLKSYKDLEIILENTLGSEEIRKKYYSDIDKSIFYTLVNTDPTSIRKKDFSKPGKYTKWLLIQYKKGRFDKGTGIGAIINRPQGLWLDKEFLKLLKYYFFIFSTGWFLHKSNIIGSEKSFFTSKLIYDENNRPTFYYNKNVTNDILRYTLDEFLDIMGPSLVEKYELQTEKSKFDVIYSNDKVDILVPLNFTASYESAKNTEWCTQSKNSFSQWSITHILFRIIPKNEKFDRLKLTYGLNNFYLACSKYPEISGNRPPFEIIDGIEYWKIIKQERDTGDNSKKWDSKKWVENSKKIDETMSLLSTDAKKFIEEYHKKHLKK